MGKGDGWVVKRYVCPKCKRKGLCLISIEANRSGMRCMYENCDGMFNTNDKQVLELNPSIEIEGIKWKP